MKHLDRLTIVLLVAALCTASAGAGVVRIDAYDAGTLAATYEETWVGPIHASMDDNPTDRKDRNYFKFDLSGVSDGTVVDAALVLEFPTGAYDSKESLERFELFDVNAGPDTFGFDFSSCTAHGFSWPVWHDLGEGVPYGRRHYRASDEGTVTRIVLNDAAIADINAAIASGGDFAIGGKLSWRTHAGIGATDPVDPDTIFKNTASTLETDICYGVPSSWTLRRLVLVVE